MVSHLLRWFREGYYTMLHRLFSLSVVVFLLGISVPAQAQTFIAADINDSTGVQGAFGTNSQTLGYSFTLSQPYYVNSLGIWDTLGNGMAETHPVGLWTDTGTLLATVTIQSGTASTFVPTVATGFLAGVLKTLLFPCF